MFGRALLLLIVFGSAGAASAGSTYLALGDSVAFGYENTQVTTSNGDRGYVAPLADALGRTLGQRPTVIDLAIPGETSTSFADLSNPYRGANTNYGPNPLAPTPISQQDFAKSEIATLGNQITTVSFAIGANDYLNLTSTQRSDPTTLAAVFASIDARYASVLGMIHTQLPNATLILPGYYNPYAPGTATHDQAALALATLNAKIQGYAAQYGGRYVDFYTPIEGNQSTLIGVGDIHPNDAGYAVLGRTAAQAVPEPSSLAAVGVGALALLRRRKR